MQPAISLSALGRERYVSLTTFRRTGEPVSTPVWIAPDTRGGTTLYMLTMVGAGKLKRIRNNPSVELAPCDVRGRVSGPSVAAFARILPPEEHAIADRALTKKYPLQKRALDLYHYLAKGRRTYLAIESTPPRRTSATPPGDSIRPPVSDAGYTAAGTGRRASL